MIRSNGLKTIATYRLNIEEINIRHISKILDRLPGEAVEVTRTNETITNNVTNRIVLS